MNTLKSLTGAEPPLVVIWPARGELGQNWGDKLNPWIVSRLSGRSVINASAVYRSAVPLVYAVVGSGIGQIRTPNTKIFGSGFLSQTDELLVEVQGICAVRGPHSAHKLRDRVDVAALAIGDPALLMPLLYRPPAKKTHKVGIIPHFRERQLPLYASMRDDSSLAVIDITESIEGFCDQVCSCETIVSSSLHGAILAHAFGIPARIVRTSDLPRGDGFKLGDYLSSVGLEEDGVRTCATRSELLGAAETALVPRKFPSLNALLQACPFIQPTIKADLMQQIPNSYKWLAYAN